MTLYVPTASELAFLADTLFQDIACDRHCLTNEIFGKEKQANAERCVEKKLVYEDKCIEDDTSTHFHLTVRGRDALKRGFERFLRLDVERMRAR
jgi:hypothetical protein